VRAIRHHSALRRHRQYIGKLMRRIDPEPLQRPWTPCTRRRDEAPGFHELEALRDRLLREGDAAMPDRAYRSLPGADRQQLRQLLREARARAASAEQPAGS
jgi:ribosome-associated protein